MRSGTSRRPTPASALILPLFFASGASSLVYEVVWVRHFGLLFGSTVYSAALVTGLFMGGLGLGGYLAGVWVDARFRAGRARALRAYGVCELAIGAWAGLLVFAIPWVAALTVHSSSYFRGEHGWYWLSATGSWVRYGCAALLLLPPTLLMGATLPLLIRHRIGDPLLLAGWHVGVLYGVNTAGAALGCLLADTVLVPALGLRATQWAAVGLNLFAGTGAVWLARRAREGAARENATRVAAPPARPAPGRRRPPRRLDGAVVWTAATLALGGFAAMAMQIVWFRFLISLYGPYRPVFSLLLTVILLGIGLGSHLGGALARRVGQASVLYALTLTGFGVCAAGALLLAPADAAERVQALLRSGAGGGGAWAFHRLVLEGALAAVAAPALLSGAAFPLANAIVQTRPDAVAERAGALYLANTLGAVLGSLVGGFALLPRLGVQGTAGAVLLCVVVALLTLARARGKTGGRQRVAWAACTVASAAALLAWRELPQQTLLRRSLPPGIQRQGERILAAREGVNETLAVSESEMGLRLATNGYGMSGTFFSAQRYMRAFLHVPMLLGDGIENVMVMGYGVGNTAHAALVHPEIRRVDVVELSWDILEQAGYFGVANGDPLSDPRVRVYVNDARHHLRMLPGPTYDLITGEPPPISHAGVVNLYTREFFELARTRLRPGGILSYWLPAAQVGAATTRSVVRAFLDVFPGAVLLSGYRHQLVLLGRRAGPLEVDPERIRRRVEASPALRRELRWISLDRPVEWVGMLAATADTLERATRGVEALRDDRPLLEYGARELVRDRFLPENLFSIGDVEKWCPRCGELPAEEALELRGYLDVVGRYYRSAAFLHHQPSRTLAFRPRLSPNSQRAARRSLYLRDLVQKVPRAYHAALAQARHGRTEEAVATLRELPEPDPRDPELQLEVAELLLTLGRAAEARRHLEAVRGTARGDPLWRELEAIDGGAPPP
jgi:spermidine synthase